MQTAEKMVLRNKGCVKAEDTWPMMPLDVEVTFLESPPTNLRQLACELGLISTPNRALLELTGAVYGGLDRESARVCQLLKCISVLTQKFQTTFAR